MTSNLMTPFRLFCNKNKVKFNRNTIYLRPPNDDGWTPHITLLKYDKETDQYFVICKQYCHWKSNDFSDWMTYDEIIDIVKKGHGIKSYDIRANKSA